MSINAPRSSILVPFETYSDISRSATWKTVLLTQVKWLFIMICGKIDDFCPAFQG